MSETEATIGSMRLHSDMRQIAALMAFTGICALFQPLPNIATRIGPDGTTASSGIAFSSLFGGLCLATIGFLSVFAGYNQLVHAWGNKYLTGFLILFTQTAFIPYITDMTNIGQIARSGSGFIPDGYEPTDGEVKFVGAMGICGVVAYGFSFVGAVAFMQFSLFAYQAGKPEDRSAPYYRGRLTFYCAMHFLAGISQLMLGAFISKNFGGGALPETIGVAMYVVNFPAISITLGIIQVFNALWGFARSFDIGVFGEKDMSYQVSMFAGWFLQVLLQAIVQVSYSPGGQLAPATTTITAMTVGLNLMPAFLDYKSRTLPEEISPDYYGLESVGFTDAGGEKSNMEMAENTVLVAEGEKSNTEMAENTEFVAEA